MSSKRNWYYTISGEKVLLYPVISGPKENIGFLKGCLCEPTDRLRRSPKRHTRLGKRYICRLVEYGEYDINFCPDLFFSETNFRETFRILGIIYA